MISQWSNDSFYRTPSTDIYVNGITANSTTCLISWTSTKDGVVTTLASATFGGGAFTSIGTGATELACGSHLHTGQYSTYGHTHSYYATTTWVTSNLTITYNAIINIINGHHSDSRLKENIIDLKNSHPSALNTIGKLKPKKFNFTDIFKSNLSNNYLPLQSQSQPQSDSEDEIGFLYEDVKEIIPEATSKVKQEKWWETGKTEDYKKEAYGRVNNATLVPLLVQALQELNDKVEILEKKLQDKEED